MSKARGTPPAGQKVVPFPLRAPRAIYEAAVKVAERQGRSINHQMCIWMERGMPAELLDPTKADAFVDAMEVR